MQWMSDFRTALNQAINDGLAEQGRTLSSRQHVHSVRPFAAKPRYAYPRADPMYGVQLSLVCGSPFFGYEDRETPFLRLQLYNPRMVARAAGVLRAGSVLGTPFQPHEAHVPYLLQLLLDFNLKGMGDLRLARFKVRWRALRSTAAPTHRFGVAPSSLLTGRQPFAVSAPAAGSRPQPSQLLPRDDRNLCPR